MRSRLQFVLLACLSLFAANCATEKADGRPYIWKIRVRGTHVLKPKDIVAKISISETSWIPFAYKHYLDPFATDVDRKRIEAFYAANGYFAAKVTKVDIAQRKNGKSVNVTFTVKEGPPVKIEKVTVLNVDQVQSDLKVWLKYVHKRLRVGNVFVHDTFEAEKDHLEHDLEEKGYAWAKVTGTADVNRDTLTAEITLTAKPGVKTHFGAPTIEGNVKTNSKFSLIHAELPTGKTYSPDEIDDARGALYNLGTFSSVRIEKKHDPSDPTVVLPHVIVQEGQFHELRIGGGFGIEGLTSGVERIDAHLIGTYTKNNFLGGFRTLRLTLKPAYVLYHAAGITRYGPAVTAQAEFTQPDLWWPRLKFRWMVAYDVGIELAYQYTGPRTLVGLSRAFFNNRLTLGVSYNFQFWKFFGTDPTVLQSGDAGSLFGYTDPYRLGWLQQDISLDLRDHPLDTHYGAYLGVSFEEGGEYAGGSFTYEKFQPDVRGYIPLGKRITLAGRFEYGEIHAQGADGTPTSRRFYLGGPNSHRGFTYDRLSPQVYDSTYKTTLPVGGDKMVLMQGEVRAHLFKLLGSWFGAVAFVDAGDVSAPACKSTNCTGEPIPNPANPKTPYPAYPLYGWRTAIDYSNLHVAAGGGLRYKTIIGTIRVDLGVRLNRLGYGYEGGYNTSGHYGRGPGADNPDPGSRIAFHISIGEAF